MSTNELEHLLAKLDAMPPPADLRNRCYRTIPINATAASFRRPMIKRGKTMYQIAIGLLIFGMISLRTIHPPLPNSAVPASGIAFAQIVEATQQISFYHLKAQTMGFDPSGGDDGKTWYTGRWVNEETWFDTDQGSYSLSGGPTFAASQELWLPNGAIYNRVGDHLKIIQFTPKAWRSNAQNTIRHLLDLRTSARGFNDAVDPKQEPKHAGIWRGKPVIIFTFIAPPSPKNIARGAPTVQSLFYVDASTKLCIAEQQYARSQNGVNHIVNQWEFDYTQRPSLSFFDPKRIEAGASEISHAVGGPNVSLDPDENDMGTPTQ